MMKKIYCIFLTQNTKLSITSQNLKLKYNLCIEKQKIKIF